MCVPLCVILHNNSKRMKCEYYVVCENSLDNLILNCLIKLKVTAGLIDFKYQFLECGPLS